MVTEGGDGQINRDTAPLLNFRILKHPIFMTARASLDYTAKNAPPAIQIKGLFLWYRGM